ncbi:MAG: M20/M25/M40 family metallo-hydrolase [Rhizomicrobium sp.]
MNRSRASINLAVTIALLAIAAGFWFLQAYGRAQPAVAPADTSPRVFSASRAEAVLAKILGPEKPHPVSTEENARVRARIVRELSGLGLHPFVHRAFACHPPHRDGLLTCATVNDIIAQVIPGAGKAVVLLAHYDSVPAGPGAADDESGVAAVIETARALIARKNRPLHPVLAVLTDGEEADLLGAAAFLHDPALKARVGAVVNVEARGNRGPSILFQTSPGDGPLIDLYAKGTSIRTTSSLYDEIYRFLPNDTDLTLFIADGFPSFNFAYAGGVFDYHTANDTRANLDPRSLQEQGDNMLGVAGALEQADFAKLSGQNEIYLDILGRWLPRVPESWAVPLAIAAFVLLLIGGLLARGPRIGPAGWLQAFAIPPVLLIVGVGSGFVLHGIAAAVSGTPVPAYAHPAAFRIALALALDGAALLAARLAPVRAAALAVWLWLAGAGIAVAILVPGFSPYFLIPSVVAGILLLLAARAPGSWDGAFGLAALFLAALVSFLIWSAIGTAGETLMGMRGHPLFTVPFAIALSALVPLFARFALARTSWIAALVSLFIAATVAAVVQGYEPAFSVEAAQRLEATYVEYAGKAYWALDAQAPVPASMKAVAPFAPSPRHFANATPRLYAAPAGPPLYPLPTAIVSASPMSHGARRIQLRLRSSGQANQMFVDIPQSAKLLAIDVAGWHVVAPAEWSKEYDINFACMSRDCATIAPTLILASGAAVTLGIYERRFGLPASARRLIAARPATAVSSWEGDSTLLIGEVRVPAAR